MSRFHAASAAADPAAANPRSGRSKKLLPVSTNLPRFSRKIFRRTTYFQYAACSVSSQML